MDNQKLENYFDNIEIAYDDQVAEKNPDGLITLRNPHLKDLEYDTLYHLSLNTKTDDFPKLFGDVKFICMGGTCNRMKLFAETIAYELNIDLNNEPLVNLSMKAGRFSMYKVGPVLSISHGMGISSFSILLHEIFKLVYYAKCKNPIFFRIGTSGGIGVDPGTVVITDNAVDELMRPFFELPILGKLVRRPCIFDKDLIEELKEVASKQQNDYKTITGTTMCAMDFYETQSRLDGAFCNYTIDDKNRQLNKLKEHGVVNIEMECTLFSSMCHYANVQGAIVCVTFLNRLFGDQVNETKEMLNQFQTRPIKLVVDFIKKRLSQQQ